MKLAIDFGTTKVSVAYLNNKDEPCVMALDENGHGLMPCSIFLQEDGSFLFGQEADDEAVTNPANYTRSFKTQLGSSIPVLGNYTAHQLVTEFLRHLLQRVRADATLRRNRITGALLTCPVAFTPNQRELLTQAALDAGLPKVELVTEPEAAGVAFCHYCRESAFKEQALVVDWGGGTLDVALVSKRDKFRVSNPRYTAGDNLLGGEVFDDCLASYVMDHLPDTIKPQHIPWFRMVPCLRELKCSLSDAESDVFNMSVGANQIRLTVTRSTFEKLIEQDVRKAVQLVKNLLANLSKEEQPEMLVLVGGTTRIPCILRELQAATGLPTHTWMDAREAVVKGAALLGKETRQKKSNRLFYICYLCVLFVLLSISAIVEREAAYACTALWMWVVPSLRMIYGRRLIRMLWQFPLLLLLTTAWMYVWSEKLPLLLAPTHQATGLRIVKGQLDSQLAENWLQAGCPIDSQVNGDPLLHWLARYDCSQLLESMCRRDSDVNVLFNGESPLHVAARLGHVSSAEILVAYGADVDLRNAAGKTAYEMALAENKAETAAFLELYTAEGKARFREEEDCAETSSIMGAIEAGDTNRFRLSFYRGGPTNNKNLVSALMSAVNRGNTEILSLLLTRADGEVINDNFILHAALENGSAEALVKRLLATPGIDVNKVNENKNAPLHCAMWRANTEALVKNLLDTPGIDVNIVNERGNTALHDAIRQPSSETLVKLLLTFPYINVNIRNKVGNTPLHRALLQKNGEKLVKMLLSIPHIDVNVRNKAGNTPLHRALLLENGEPLVKLLLAVPHIDVNEVDNDGNTPLHIAAAMGNKEVVKALLKHSHHTVHIKNKAGFTPYQLAEKNGRRDCAALIISTQQQ